MRSRLQGGGLGSAGEMIRRRGAWRELFFYSFDIIIFF